MLNTEPAALTSEQKRDLFGYAQRLWETIAFDLFNAVAEGQEQNVNDVTIPREEVLELVLDAGRLEDDLKRAGRQDLIQFLKDTPYPVLTKLLKQSFIHTSYGL